jgi:hypothetical protein
MALALRPTQKKEASTFRCRPRKTTLLASFAYRPKTLRAEFNLHRNATIERERRLLNVWPPHAAGVPLGEAYIVAKGRLFATKLTGCHSRKTSSASPSVASLYETLRAKYTISRAAWQT